MAGGRGLAGCGHLLVSPRLLLPLLLALSGSLALVCLPCDDSKCEEPRNCPGSIVQGVCGCCYMCARQKNETCGGAYGLHGACDRGLRCVIRPPLNGDSITEYEVGVCEGRAPPARRARSPGAEQSLAETFPWRKDPAGEGAAPAPGRASPRPPYPGSRSLPPPAPALGPPRVRLRFVGGGGPVGGHPQPRTGSHTCGRSGPGWVWWSGPAPRGGAPREGALRRRPGAPRGPRAPRPH